MKEIIITAALCILVFPATASAHPNGLNTWSLYKDAHLSLEAPDVSEELDPTTARAERRYDGTVARLRSKWQVFDAAYWASLEPEPEPVAEPQEIEQEVVPSGDIWSQLAMCESSMTNDLGAPYYGYFQFDRQTWNIYLPGVASDYSYATQLAITQRHQAAYGWEPWPGCSAKLGLL